MRIPSLSSQRVGFYWFNTRFYSVVCKFSGTYFTWILNAKRAIYIRVLCYYIFVFLLILFGSVNTFISCARCQAHIPIEFRTAVVKKKKHYWFNFYLIFGIRTVLKHFNTIRCTKVNKKKNSVSKQHNVVLRNGALRTRPEKTRISIHYILYDFGTKTFWR